MNAKRGKISEENVKHPLMYKGWLIRTKEGKFGAENLATGDILFPNYLSWELLKLIIDNRKIG